MLDVMVKEMEMINISTLPLTVTLALNYPFTLVCQEDTQTQKQTLVLQSGEIVKVNIKNRTNQEILVPDWLITSHVTKR